QPVVYGVDTMGDNEDRAFLALGQKVTHGAIQRASHFYRFATAGDERKRAGDFTYFMGGGFEDDLSRRFGSQAKELVGLGFG
ncbi:MAG TPA: hypothetical protein VN974_05825, partial [Candidatus Dormibacteraeota bacterium]|nr:hypothetical protein [Candidatus Dormibacteraeota bacterium]